MVERKAAKRYPRKPTLAKNLSERGGSAGKKQRDRFKSGSQPALAPLPKTTDDQLTRVAYHEAGHAVLACLLREPFDFVSIERKGREGGRMVGRNRIIGETRRFVERGGLHPYADCRNER